MMRAVLIVAICCSLLGCHRTFGVPTDIVQDLPALASVRSVYIADLTHGEDPYLVEGSDQVRKRIQERLVQSKRFSVVDTLEEADAALTGVAGFQRWYFGMESFYGLEGSLNTQYAGIGMVRLLDSKTKQLIWAHEYETGFFHPTQSVIDRVADQVADKLLSDAIRAEGTNHRTQ
jgi:TolB-like protein